MPDAGNNNGKNYVDYGGSVRVGGDRNWRNNNPGNIEASDFATAHGATGSDGRFAIFPDYQTGMDALHSLLGTDTYQSLSVGDAIERYAPSNENSTDRYTSIVENRVGVDASTSMSDLTPEQFNALAETIEHVEGGHEGDTYDANSSDAPDWVGDLLQTNDSGDSDSSGDSKDEENMDAPEDPRAQPDPGQAQTPGPNDQGGGSDSGD